MKSKGLGDSVAQLTKMTGLDNLITKGVPLGCWGSYVAEEHFINTLTTGGTIWRWREDPDQIIYQTDLSPNLWHTNVWNYHDFKRATDSLPYPIPTTGSWTGSSTGGPSTFQKIEDFLVELITVELDIDSTHTL